MPRSTVYHWARTSVLVPSVSQTKIQLWSYTDLMGVRIIYWLRQPKRAHDGDEIPATSMPAVRRALGELKRLDLPLWTPRRCSVVVTREGHVYIDAPDVLQTPDGQTGLREILDVTGPFSSQEGLRGPDLVQPRPLLRIIPGKLSGSPHVAGTRVETRALSALRDSGLPESKIVTLYPYLTPSQVSEAIDLEEQLKNNLACVA